MPHALVHATEVVELAGEVRERHLAAQEGLDQIPLSRLGALREQGLADKLGRPLLLLRPAPGLWAKQCLCGVPCQRVLQHAEPAARDVGQADLPGQNSQCLLVPFLVSLLMARLVHEGPHLFQVARLQLQALDTAAGQLQCRTDAEALGAGARWSALRRVRLIPRPRSPRNRGLPAPIRRPGAAAAAPFRLVLPLRHLDDERGHNLEPEFLPVPLVCVP
mmetsp:Transcript_57134/g.185703  ORF Transcript_57134/g.185703 Transcript_57134/m.185703 type:complete len:219 (+) Transcript_57134:1848-2504(+)